MNSLSEKHFLLLKFAYLSYLLSSNTSEFGTYQFFTRSVFFYLMFTLVYVYLNYGSTQLENFKLLKKIKNKAFRRNVLRYMVPLLVIFITVSLNFYILSKKPYDMLDVIELIILLTLIVFFTNFKFYYHSSNPTKSSDPRLINSLVAYDDPRILTLHRGANRFVKASDILLVYHSNQINWVVTKSHEQLISSVSLIRMSEILGGLTFMMINRNVIVSRDSIDKFRSSDYGKIEITLTYQRMSAIVSKGRAKKFRTWFKQ